MNRFLKTLELHKILDMLVDEATSETAKEIASELDVMTNPDEVRLEIEKTSVLQELTVKHGSPALLAVKNVAGSLHRAESGASLSLRELLNIGGLLSQIRILREWYEDSGAEHTILNDMFWQLAPNSYLEGKIKNSIISEDEISDSASPELASIRRKIAQSGQKIRDSLDKMLRSSQTQKYLQESLITLRDGRYVLPVRAEYKNNVPGLVHDTSSSGATLFIEPISVVEANNDIRILEGKEQEEIERIIAELSSECAAYSVSMLRDLESCAEIDFYFAKVTLADKMKATAPEIRTDGVMLLKNARHPLIAKEKVVPVTIELGKTCRALMITGPNTGGKTVVLKTAGLLTAMTMCGLLIPVSDGSQVTVFREILADIGDQQSIEQSLSTFSSHMSQIAGILNRAGSDTLILLDELGSGTDPVEGAALAVSIIETLLSRNARIMVTTHYQELKLFAIENEMTENASCEFNLETLQPTYRLIIGSPGRSNAFAISEKLGISKSVIEHAKELVDSETQRFEEVVEQLEKSRTQLEEERSRLKTLLSEAERDKEQLSAQLSELKRNKDKELEQARLQSMQIIERVRRQSDEIIDELDAVRKQKEKENFSQMSVQAKSSVRSALDKLYMEANPVVDDNSGYKPPRKLRKGDYVFIVDANKEGVLLSDPDPKGNVFVQSGLMKTKLSVKKLRLVEAQKKAPDKKSKISTKNVRSQLERSGSMELDIRGCASDEGVHEMEQFLDGAIMSGIGIVTIIHGKGTGVLRNAIHQSLKRNPAVKSFRLGVYGEGESGVTIVELK